MSDEGLHAVPDAPDFGLAVARLVPGQVLNNQYVLRERLGSGGMGVVWLAQDSYLDEPVALKFLPEKVRLDEDSLRQLKNETKRSKALNDYHIVRIDHLVRDGTIACIVMEYVDGLTLKQIKDQKPCGHLEVREISEWIRQLCQALAYAHNSKAGILHRDLKPANLMINRMGELRVTDFGIACSVKEQINRVGQNLSVSGTLYYMSPQHLLGSAKRSDDIYSLGATIFELLTGTPPFYRGDSKDIRRQIENEVAPSMTSRRTELDLLGEPIPPRWEQVVAACLAKEPRDRPQKVEDVAERLGIPITPSMETRTMLDQTTLDVKPPPPEPAKKSGAPWAAIVLLALAAIGAFGWYFWNSSIRHKPPDNEPEPVVHQANVPTNQNPTKPPMPTNQIADANAKVGAATATNTPPQPAPDLNKQPVAAAAPQSPAGKTNDANTNALVLTPTPNPAAAPQSPTGKTNDAKTNAIVAPPPIPSPALAQQPPAEEKPVEDQNQTPAEAAWPREGEQWHSKTLNVDFKPAGTPGVLFSVYDTRLGEFRKFVNAIGYTSTGTATFQFYHKNKDKWDEWDKTEDKTNAPSWQYPGFPLDKEKHEQEEDCPVVGVTVADAYAYCKWLTEQDQKENKLGMNQCYRLPTNDEWSAAVGNSRYPWGDQMDDNDSPPEKAGNYFDQAKAEGFTPEAFAERAPFAGNCGYVRTSPVGMFNPNKYGLYDMGGNVWQWCSDIYKKEMNAEKTEMNGRNPYYEADPYLKNDEKPIFVARGAAWCDGGRDGKGRDVRVKLESQFCNRSGSSWNYCDDNTGFRCVVDTRHGLPDDPTSDFARSSDGN
jgi:serine/threonine protein kinase/formylglycine-generating enzyme required for sulfatase activity